jgi:hypothetical protein
VGGRAVFLQVSLGLSRRRLCNNRAFIELPAHNAENKRGRNQFEGVDRAPHIRRPGVAAAAVLPAAPAGAEPAPDPHMPNMQSGCCPGGGMGSQISLAYCDGVPYPDGTFWHSIQYGAPMIGHPYGLLSPGLQCVAGGGPVPQPAPPGVCGGAVPPAPPPSSQLHFYSLTQARKDFPAGCLHGTRRVSVRSAGYRRRPAVQCPRGRPDRLGLW